jgi:hypothetical protein
MGVKTASTGMTPMGAGIECCQMQLRVHNLEVGGALDIAGGDFAFAGGFQEEFARPVREGAQPDFLHVEDELYGVLFDMRDSGELVDDFFDANGGDGGAGQRAEEDASESVPHGNAESGFEWLSDYAGIGIGAFLDLELRGHRFGAWHTFPLLAKRLWRYQFLRLPLLTLNFNVSSTLRLRGDRTGRRPPAIPDIAGLCR